MNGREEEDVRALLAGFDAGPVPELDVDAIMRGGRRYRRRHTVYRGVATLAAVAVVGGVFVASTQLVRHRVVLPATTSSAPAPSPSATAVGTSCTAAELIAEQTSSGAGMSQPFAIITVTNRGSRACTLTGYPTITAASGTEIKPTGTSPGPLTDEPISVTNGALNAVADPGPRTLRVAPGGHAWFALGTATAYDGPVVTLGRVSVSLDGSSAPGAGALAIPVDLAAGAPAGKPFGIKVTAYAPGTYATEPAPSSSTTAGTPAKGDATSGSGVAQACLISDLRLGLSGKAHSTQQYVMTLDATNISLSPCSLTGFPGFELVGPLSNGSTTYDPVRQSTTYSRVVLAPGATAHAAFTVLPGPDICDQGTAWVPTSVTVILPDATTPTSVPWPGGSVDDCQGGATHPGTYIGPFTAGS